MTLSIINSNFVIKYRWRFILIIIKPLSVKEAVEKSLIIDDYLKELTVLNIQKITDGKCSTLKDFLSHLPSTCIAWSDENLRRIRGIEGVINYQLDEVGFNLNMEVNIIQTNGKDSFELPYTRGDSIFIPVKENMKSELGSLTAHLITHEIFHIISRKFPQIRNPLYSLFGFNTLPERFDMKKFLPNYAVNPDAVYYDHSISVVHNDGKTYNAIPMIYFSNDKKMRMKWENLILLNENYVPAFIDHRKKTTYNEMNFNTWYLSHPEEICAENFRKWILEVEDLDNPELIEEFKKTMKGLFN